MLLRHLLAVLLCLLIAPCCAAASSGGRTNQPHLHLPERQWDFGEVAEGEKPKHTFAIENTGRARLAVRRVLHSCGGCFVTELAESKLAPGGRTTLELTVLTARRPGSFRKYLYLESNDPRLRRRRITITGTIKPRKDMEPGTEAAGPEPEQTVDLNEATEAKGDRPVRIAYFTSLTCEECRATSKALRRLRKAHAALEVRELDIDDLANYAVMLTMEETYGRIKHAPPAGLLDLQQRRRHRCLQRLEPPPRPPFSVRAHLRQLGIRQDLQDRQDGRRILSIL